MHCPRTRPLTTASSPHTSGYRLSPSPLAAASRYPLAPVSLLLSDWQWHLLHDQIQTPHSPVSDPRLPCTHVYSQPACLALFSLHKPFLQLSGFNQSLIPDSVGPTFHTSAFENTHSWKAFLIPLICEILQLGSHLCTEATLCLCRVLPRSAVHLSRAWHLGVSHTQTYRLAPRSESTLQPVLQVRTQNGPLSSPSRQPGPLTLPLAASPGVLPSF